MVAEESLDGFPADGDNLCRHLRFSLPVALKDCPETGLLRRLQAWRPGISPGTVALLIQRIRSVIKKSQAYLGSVVLRISCR
eukprot:3190684-Pyramimonas_sp.AAC.1